MKACIASDPWVKLAGSSCKARPALSGLLPTSETFHVVQAAEVDARMLGALLTGVRRAFPYVESGKAEGVATAHADALFRILHTAPFGVAVQALALLFQLLSARSAVSDRFYRCRSCRPFTVQALQYDEHS